MRKKFGMIRKNDIKNVADVERVWNVLLDNGYIDEKGHLQEKIKIKNHDLVEDLSVFSENDRRVIYKKLKRAYIRSFDFWWEEWIKPVLIAAVLALIIRTFIIQPFKIPTSSMYPTLRPGDRIFVSKFIYGAKIPFTNIRFGKVRNPVLGDIVVFVSPAEEKKKYLVKRYIAGPGQTVNIKDGNIYVDGELVERYPIRNFYYYNRGKFGQEGEDIVVPEDKFFVLGDNSANSLDSRFWGFAPEENLVGKALIIHWPIRRVRLLGDTE